MSVENKPYLSRLNTIWQQLETQKASIDKDPATTKEPSDLYTQWHCDAGCKNSSCRFTEEPSDLYTQWHCDAACKNSSCRSGESQEDSNPTPTSRP